MEQKRLDPKTDTRQLINWYCDYKRLSLFLELAKGYKSPEEALKENKAPAADWIQDLTANPMVWMFEGGIIEIKLLQGVKEKYAEVFVFHPDQNKEHSLYMQAYGVCFHKLKVDQIIVNFLQVNTRLLDKTMIPEILTKDPDIKEEKQNGTSTKADIQPSNNPVTSKRGAGGRFIKQKSAG